MNTKYNISTNILGTGGFAKVYSGTTLDGNSVAIKVIDMLSPNMQLPKSVEKLVQEVYILETFDHPNIVKCLDIYRETKFWYIVLEFCHGTMSDVISWLQLASYSDEETEKFIFYYINQLKDALKYVNDQEYVHRDIKPDNILLFRPTESTGWSIGTKAIVKLADFGLARQNEDGMMNTVCGSPLFMSPEILLHNKYNSKSDLWSVGLVIYKLMYKKHPLNARTCNELKAMMQTKTIQYSDEQKYSPELMNLIQGLLNKSMSDRLEWSQFINHEWFDIVDLNLSDYQIINEPNQPIVQPIYKIESSPLTGSNLSKMKHGYQRKTVPIKSSSINVSTLLGFS